jgi:CARDB/F5/8 type C domain/NedA-like, galactose-binding domain
MKRTLHRWYVISGVLAASLVAVGLTQVAADAATTGPNLAAGRPATASSSHSEYPASNVTDGNQASYWESGSSSFPQWIQVDLGSAVDVNQAVLKLPTSWGARTQTLTVQGDTNGTDFSILSASAGRLFDPTTSNTVTIEFPKTSVRYVRVTITANTGWPAGQLSEFELYGPGGTTDPGGNAVNVAAGKPMEASSVTQSYVAANANDNNVTTYWESSGFPSTLTAKLGANADISSIVVKLNPDSIWEPRTQNIEVLGRAQGATDFASIKARADYAFSPSTNQNTVTIPVSGPAADVQLKFYSNTGAPGGQVAEMLVMGTWSSNPDLVVTGLTWTPSAPDETTEITFSATVHNSGAVQSGATTVNVVLNETVAGSASVGALAAGASATVSVSAARQTQGTYTVAAVVDPGNAVIEQNEDNNTFTASSQLTVAQAPGPDLQVTSITTNPPNPSVGAAVNFTVAVNNRGTSTAGGSTTRVVVGSTTLDGATGSIAAGATLNVAIGGTWTASSGGATITATADATNQVAETNENNNQLSQAIVVGRGAAVPYVEYEAEAARYNGTLVTADAQRTFGHTNFGTESSGRQSVRLNSTGSTSSSPRPSRRTRSSCATRSRTPPTAAAWTRRSASTSTTSSSKRSPCRRSSAGCTAAPTTPRD